MADDVSDLAPFLRLVFQRCETDCGVACLAMLANVDYETALVAFQSMRPLTGGVLIREIKAAAKRLGISLRLRRAVNLDTDTGILAIRSADWKTDHVVILKEGLIIDTDSTIWDAEDHITMHRATVLSLLVKTHTPKDQ